MMHRRLGYVPRQTLLAVMYMLEKTTNKGNRPVGGDLKLGLNIVKKGVLKITTAMEEVQDYWVAAGSQF